MKPFVLVAAALALLAAAAAALVFYVMRAEPVQPATAPIARVEPPTAAGKGAGRAFERAAAPQPVPADPFLDGEGRETRFEAFRGRVVLLNFWATWCAPCVAELPSLARLQSKRGGPDFEVVALNMERGGDAMAKDFLAQHGASALAAYSDPKMKLWRAFKLNGLPTTILIDAEGREIARKIGPAEWDSPDAIAEIEALLAAD